MFNHAHHGKSSVNNGGGGGGGGGGYDPIVNSVFPATIKFTSTKTLTISGEFFTPDMTVTSSEVGISGFSFTNTESIDIVVAATTEGAVSIVLTTPIGTTTINYVIAPASSWVDLRIGGDAYTEEHQAGTTITQTTEGLQSSGSLWSNWLKITSESWQRSVPANVAIIVKTASSTMMFGIMGDGQNETSSAQYYQAEIYSYFSGTSSTSFYGKNASGSGTSGAISVISVSGYTYLKMKLMNNGEAGHSVFFYGMNSLADLDDESNLLGERTVPATLTANSATLTLCATMGNSAQRLIAVNSGL